MQTYSQDLRDRVLRALDRGDGPTEIARRFEVKALVELALQPGMSVAKLARQHDMNANVLRKWIASALGQETSAVQQPDPSTLVPVKLTESARPEKRARSAAELSFIEM